MKLLLIDDNVHLANRISHHLRKKFVIECVNTGKQGIEKAEAVEFAAILLDLRLPDMPGITVCKRLREIQNTAPILVLSANNDVATRVDLLNSGADDYLVKPFNAEELAARIDALLRRNARGYHSNILTVGDLKLDTTSRTVTRSEQKIELRRKEFDILEYLILNKGRTVTRDMILTHVWEDSKNSWHNTVDVHIKYLRDKVDRPFRVKLIKTAYGIGYMVDDPT